jgi:RNA-binding protein
MSLSETQKKYLRGLGHQLKPVIMIGDSGLTAGVSKELENAVLHHELIKVSVRVGDRQERDRVIAQICDDHAAQLVQRIGNMALVYRENPEKKKRIRLPGK